MFRDLKNNILRGISVSPQDSAAATVTGTGVDMRTASAPTCMVVVSGTASGTPSAQSVVWTVEESDSSGSGYAAVSGATVTHTADNQIDCIQLPQRTKRYIRAVAVITFTGGTSPKIEVCATAEAQKGSF